MADLLGLLGIWGTVFGVIFGVLVGFFALISKSEPSRARVIRYLEEDTAANKYRGWLTNWLDKVDKWLSAPEIERGASETSKMRAWSLGLLGVVLISALAYPILSLLTQWIITGDGTVGNVPVLPPEGNDPLRYGIGAAFLGSLGLTIFAQFRLSGWPRLVLQLGAAILLFAVVGAGAFAGAVAVAVAVAVAFAVAVIIEWLSERARLPVWPLLLWTTLAVIGTCLFIKITPGYTEAEASLILFVSVLPLLNGLTDFASLGATRYFLRQGLAGNMVVSGIKDLCAGLVIFFGLGFAIIAYIHWVRPQNDVPLIALDAMFDGLRNRPGDYWWLFLMMFSTLLPTVLHFVLWLFAGFTLLGGGIRR